MSMNMQSNSGDMQIASNERSRAMLANQPASGMYPFGQPRGPGTSGPGDWPRPSGESAVIARAKPQSTLRAKVRDMTALVARLERRAVELLRANRILERRVAEGADEAGRLSRLKSFFSPSVADILLEAASGDGLQRCRREVVVVFLDLRGFTAFAESADPEQVMSVLEEYHDAMGQLVVAHAGTLERFAGDGIMILFNAPVAIDDPAVVAIRMTIAMQQRFELLRQAWRQRGYALDLGIGVAQGYATIGTIGFKGRLDYTAIGTVTNLASRLCDAAAGGQILISQLVSECVARFARTVSIGNLALKGFCRPVEVYEVQTGCEASVSAQG